MSSSFVSPFFLSSPASSSSTTMSSVPNTPVLPSCATMPSSSIPSNHRRSRSREFWNTLGEMVGHYGVQKNMNREDGDEEMMQVEQQDSISIVLPPQLPKCKLSAAFICSETKEDIPPAFYPGQSIPTILAFSVDRYSSLPYCLNPTLTMSLVGTLHTPNSRPRTIICVSVSLSEGLALWSRDAIAAHRIRPRETLMDPKDGLPGGSYSLPLTVQVPLTPRLPPSFNVPTATFSVAYSLNVVLTCDDPAQPGRRVILAEAGRSFDMIPETLPTRPPKYNPITFWVRSESQLNGGAIGTAKGLIRRTNSRWIIETSLPTTTYSPTSKIPLSIILFPPQPSQDNYTLPPPLDYQILIRLALIRREHSSPTPINFQDPQDQTGLICEEEISSRFGWIQNIGSIRPISISDIVLPIMLGTEWKYGFSTMLNVGPACPCPNSSQPEWESISVSSTFYLALTMAFLPLPNQIEKFIPPFLLPPMGRFTQAVPPTSPFYLHLSHLKRHFPGTIRTLPLPVVIGSVSEPRGALYYSRWSDLRLERNPANGQEVGSMVNGEGLGCEDGWIVPPPDYGEAIQTVPYEF